MAVQFFSAQTRIPTLPRARLKLFLQEMFNQEGKVLDELVYVFGTDEHLLKINRQFLHHDYYTDIITFDISATKGEVTGEVYISIDRVRENAKTYSQTFKQELLRVIFHGALHLCGYKDKTKAQQIKMRQKENHYLSMFHK